MVVVHILHTVEQQQQVHRLGISGRLRWECVWWWGGGGVTGNKGDQLAVAQTIVGFAKGTEEGERAKGEARLCVTG